MAVERQARSGGTVDGESTAAEASSGHIVGIVVGILVGGEEEVGVLQPVVADCHDPGAAIAVVQPGSNLLKVPTTELDLLPARVDYNRHDTLRHLQAEGVGQALALGRLHGVDIDCTLHPMLLYSERMGSNEIAVG